MTYLPEFTRGNALRLLWKDGVAGQLFDATSVPATLADMHAIVEAQDPSGIVHPAGLTGWFSMFGEGELALSDGQRVLVVGEAPDEERFFTSEDLQRQVWCGPWIAHAGAWTRPTDADAWAEIQDAVVECPMVFGDTGGQYARYALWNPTGVERVVDTDPQFWIMINNPSDSRSTISVSAVSTGPVTRNGSQNVDDLITGEGHMVVLKDQVDPVENGYYITHDPGDWERLNDPVLFPQTTLESKPAQPSNGTVNNGLMFKLVNTSSTSLVAGVDPWVFVLLDANNSRDFGPVRVPVNFEDTVMCRSFYDDGNLKFNAVILQLPPITPSSRGKRVYVRGYSDKKSFSFNGNIVAQPAGTDSIMGFAPSTPIVFQEAPIMELLSDGVNTWIPAGVVEPEMLEFRVG